MIVGSRGDRSGGGRKTEMASPGIPERLKVAPPRFDIPCRKMSGFGELPQRARLWIAFVVAAGTILVVAQLPSVAAWNSQDLLAWVGLSAVTALLEQFTVKIAHRSEVENYSLTDAFWVPALIFAPGSVLILGVWAGIIVGQVARGWKWFKVAYNTSQFVIALTAARVVYGLFHLEPTLSLMVWLAAAVAMLTYFVLNEVFVAAVISSVEGESLRSLLVLPDGLNLLHAAGNLTIGLLAALVWDSGPIGIPLLIAPMVLVFLAYRGWLHAQKEQEQAKERLRMQTLYEAGKELSGPLEQDYDFAPFLALVRRMLDASAVELVMAGEEVRVFTSEIGLALHLPAEESHPPLERFVSVRPGLTTYIAPVGEAGRSGVLAIHRQASLNESETAIVDALASQVHVRSENERLFHETMDQRSHLSDVISNTSDGIFVVDANAQLLSWNPAMERITGVSRADAVGRSCEEVLALHVVDEDSGETTRVPVPLSDIESRDTLVTRPDGTQRWIRCTSSQMPGHEGGARPSVIVARDVTSELETEQLKSDFVATVSHELRSPLTPLKGFIAALREGLLDDSPEVRQEYYEIMWRGIGRLERLINDLLDVSRVEAGKLTMDAVPIELDPFVENVVREIRREHPERSIELSASDSLITVYADAFRVSQVIANLVSNALKYSPATAPIAVTVAATPTHAVISVRDHGDGIAPEDQPLVFDRFFRARSNATERSGGVGLGLFICRRLVEAMGGEITLESREEGGSTFSFTLPLVGADGQTPAEGIDGQVADDVGAAIVS
jgi:PAS domain S-box-containing protein